MLVIDERNLTGEELAYAKFFNVAHSGDFWGEGWRLVLWRSNPLINGLPSAYSPDPVTDYIVAFGWQGPQGEPVWRTTSLSTVMENLDLLDDSEVVLAHEPLPHEIWNKLEESLGYRRRMKRQRLGWWFENIEHAPELEPQHKPTGALLFEGEKENPPGNALVLVDVDNYWCVLSELGRGTYRASAQLTNGQEMFFIPQKDDFYLHLEMWKVRFVDFLEFDRISDLFGPEAEDRARPDAPSIRVEVTLCVGK